MICSGLPAYHLGPWGMLVKGPGKVSNDCDSHLQVQRGGLKLICTHREPPIRLRLTSSMFRIQQVDDVRLVPAGRTTELSWRNLQVGCP